MPLFSDIKNKIKKHRKSISQLEKKEKRTPAKNVAVYGVSFEIDGNTTNVLIYRSSNLKKENTYPTILHIRGTGYNSSASYYAYITCSQLAEKSHCQVIDINHRLAPEFKCPIGFNDCYDKIKYICNNAKKFDIDINNIAILGYSSGGNFAALSTIQAMKDNLPISLQILVSPVTDLSRSLTSHLFFENKDNFPELLAKWFIKLYLSYSCDPRSPEISPYHSKESHKLPPTFFIFGQNDRFRSDSENYSYKLIKSGVWTHISIFKDAGHIFFWHDIRAIEKISAQVYTAFNLSTIQRPIEKKEESSVEKSFPVLRI